MEQKDYQEEDFEDIPVDQLYRQISPLVSNKELVLFIGEKASHYLYIWSKRPRWQDHWNPSAALFPFCWLLYRKMYLPFLLCIALIFGAGFVWGALGLHTDIIDRLLGIFYCPYFFFDQRQIDTVHEAGVGLLIVSCLAKFANSFYKAHAIKKIRAIKSMGLSDEETQQKIASAGGTSPLGIIATGVFLVVICYSYYGVVYFCSNQNFTREIQNLTTEIVQRQQPSVHCVRVELEQRKQLIKNGVYPAVVHFDNKDQARILATLYIRSVAVEIKKYQINDEHIKSFAESQFANLIKDDPRFQNVHRQKMSVVGRDYSKGIYTVLIELSDGNQIKVALEMSGYRDFKAKIAQYIESETTRRARITKEARERVDKIVQKIPKYEKVSCKGIEIQRHQEAYIPGAPEFYYAAARLSNEHLAIIKINSHNTEVSLLEIMVAANKQQIATTIQRHMKILGLMSSQQQNPMGLFLGISELEKPTKDQQEVIEISKSIIDQIVQQRIAPEVHCTQLEIAEKAPGTYQGSAQLSSNNTIEVEIRVNDERISVTIKKIL